MNAATVHPLADAWPYGESTDPGVVLWEACLRAWRMDLPAGATVVELGCHESDFAILLKQARPDVTVIGIDVRPSALDGPSFMGDRFVCGDASEFAVWAGLVHVHAVIALSSVEHFGLGWYGDLVNPHADTYALWNALCVTDGWLYYDVPWSPDMYIETAHYRRYRDRDLPHVVARWAKEHARAWVVPGHESALLPGRPTEDCQTQPFYYVAVWAGV